MNRVLLEKIVTHILANFAIIPSNFINLDKSKSLISPDYLLNEKLLLEIENNIIQNKIWGCQMLAGKQKIKVLLGDCSDGWEDHLEFAMVICPSDSPIYGLYWANNDLEDTDNEVMLSVSLNGKEWMECSTYLQATFLAAMEQIKDLGCSWSGCSDYQPQHQYLLSFIKFYHLAYEAKK